MLKNMPRVISPELLKILSEMGHGDEIVLADGNFPAESLAKASVYGKAVRLDGLGVPEILDGVLKLIPLDTYAEKNSFLMEVVSGDPEPKIWNEYHTILTANDLHAAVGYLERYAFYERAKGAYAIVATGEGAVYANIILKKGVVR